MNLKDRRARRYNPHLATGKTDKVADQTVRRDIGRNGWGSLKPKAATPRDNGKRASGTLNRKGGWIAN